MATNLIELLTKEFGGDTLGKLAGLLGEPESKVRAAVGGVASLLGGRQAGLVDWLASFAGIGSKSAGSLLGGWLSAADRKAIGDELRGYLDPSISLGEGVDKAAAAIADAKNKALAALGAIGSSFTAEAFTAAMNLAVINFATGSAEIPADSKDLIDRAAAILKTAPKGTVIEVGGHTDSPGDPAANQKLSEDRASAVRNALVAAGADGAVLVAKGYGDTKPVASNDTEYGKFRNRRIEYSIPAAPAK